MRFEVETARGRRTIEVKRSGGGGWTVTTDGRSIEVDFRRAGSRWSMLAGARSYEVALESQRQGRHIVHVDGRVVPVAVRIPGSGRADVDGDRSHSRGPATIVAPMPGRVVKVLVAPGDAVQARQGLVVVEAMKMENELRAPRAGTVAEVRVGEGALVEANVVLVVMT